MTPAASVAPKVPAIIPPIRTTGASSAGAATANWRRKAARSTTMVSRGRFWRRAMSAIWTISTTAMTSAGTMPARRSFTADTSAAVA